GENLPRLSLIGSFVAERLHLTLGAIRLSDAKPRDSDHCDDQQQKRKCQSKGQTPRRFEYFFVRHVIIKPSPTTTVWQSRNRRGVLPFCLTTRVEVLASFDAALVPLQLWCRRFPRLVWWSSQLRGTLCALQSKRCRFAPRCALFAVKR